MKRNGLGALLAALTAGIGLGIAPTASGVHHPLAGFTPGRSYPWPRRGNGSAKVRRAAAKRRRR